MLKTSGDVRNHVVVRNLIFACAAIATSMGCGTLPIPSLAIEGTTITIPVPRLYGVGFGRVMSHQMITAYAGDSITSLPTGIAYDAASLIEDVQRGELVLRLYGNAGTPISYLPVRAITRVYADEGAMAPDSRGQVLAYVDIPEGVVDDNSNLNDFTIEASLRRRTRTSPFPFDDVITPQVSGQDWVGWAGPTAGDRIRIEIHESPVTGASFADFTGWDLWVSGVLTDGDFEANVDGYFPLPQSAFSVSNGVAGEAPAAWQVDILYPRTKFEVVGVKSYSPRRTELLAMMAPDPNPQVLDSDGCNVGYPFGHIGFTAIEPAQHRAKAGTYMLVIKPRPLACGQNPATAADFSFFSNSLKVFDETGTDVTSQNWSIVQNLGIE